MKNPSANQRNQPPIVILPIWLQIGYSLMAENNEKSYFSGLFRQTNKIQVLVPAMEWRFKSSLPHYSENPGVCQGFFVFPRGVQKLEQR
jgi:hypothetical protein